VKKNLQVGYSKFVFTSILPIMEELEKLLGDLVAINSINPDLVPGAPGEAEIAHYIAGWLERAGLEMQLIESVTGRPNVVGIARGSGGGKTLLLNGHVDTVGAGGMRHAHTPVIKEGRLYGRGAYDMKGGLAACMVALAEARKLHLRGDVVFTAVVDEEYASLGTTRWLTTSMPTAPSSPSSPNFA
jgi:acetylornithine deacetylase